MIPVSGSGNGPLSALTVALAEAGIGFEVLDYSEHAVASGADAVAGATSGRGWGDARSGASGCTPRC